MRKIPTLFVRDPEDPARVTREVTPGCEWVADGDGLATRKYNGTAVRVDDAHRVWKRYTLRSGKTPPEDFEPATDVDPHTGKQEGWVPVSVDAPEDRWLREAVDGPTVAYAPEDRWLREAVDGSGVLPIPPGTYELCGPKVQGNPEGFECHVLVAHGEDPLQGFPTDYDRIRDRLAIMDIEGVVWWGPDGQMAKIKKRDFGLPRRPTGGDQR